MIASFINKLKMNPSTIGTKPAALLALLFLFSTAMLRAQAGCEITVKLNGYSYDTLWFGHTFGKRAVPEFFGLKQADGSYLLKNDQPMPAGMYAIMHKRSPSANFQSFPCWLADGQRKFTLETNISEPYWKPSVTGSAENLAFYNFMRVFEKMDKHLDSLIDVWRYAQDEPSFLRRVEDEESVQQFQQSFIRQYPNTMTARLIGQTMLQLPPKPAPGTPWQQAATDRWNWQRKHYFDNMDLASPDFLRQPLWLDRTDFFLFHLPPPSYDTTISVVEEVFDRLSPNPEAFQYYQKYITNSLARMSQFRLDEVFVYVVRNYLQQGRATWAQAGELQKIIDDANRMEPLFIGRKAPDMTLYDRQGTAVNIHSVQHAVTIMVFWMPDCSHCKRELPIIKKMYDKYRQQGLGVISVCGKFLDETPQCWTFVDEQQMPAEWHVLTDPQRKSNMASLFNLRSFPRIFILDADKNILFKRAGEMEELQFDQVLKGIFGK